MTDLSHVFGNDFVFFEGAGVGVAQGVEETRQRVLRRLCTNPGDYVWQPDYGAGLPGMIGDPVQALRIHGVVAAQLALEPGVDQRQPVQVAVTPREGGFVSCSITYVDVVSQTSQVVRVAG